MIIGMIEQIIELAFFIYMTINLQKNYSGNALMYYLLFIDYNILGFMHAMYMTFIINLIVHYQYVPKIINGINKNVSKINNIKTITDTAKEFMEKYYVQNIFNIIMKVGDVFHEVTTKSLIAIIRRRTPCISKEDNKIYETETVEELVGKIAIDMINRMNEDDKKSFADFFAGRFNISNLFTRTEKVENKEN